MGRSADPDPLGETPSPSRRLDARAIIALTVVASTGSVPEPAARGGPIGKGPTGGQSRGDGMPFSTATESGSIRSGAAAQLGVLARRGVRSLGRPLLAVLALLLLVGAVLSGSAGARPYGVSAAATPTKAPAVTKQPVNQTVEEGVSASFSATASGNPTPTIQWERSTNNGVSWSAIAGATASPYMIASAKTSESGYLFRAVFKNSVGEATSKAAVLTVQRAPVVTKQPASVTVEEGQNAVFESTASGFPTPTVQWQTSSNGGSTWANVAGATSNQLTVTSAKTTSSGHQYRAVFKNAAATATSEAATLTVQKAPAVTKQPTGQTVNEGQAATFEAAASGFPAPTVQWELSTDGGGSWNAIAGATSNTLTIASAKLSENGNQYRAVFTNAAAKATSNAALLTVHVPPTVTQNPTSKTVEAGESVSFEAAATGSPAPTVQWEVSTNGGGSWSQISGATATTLTIAKTQLSEDGHQFRAVFANAGGQATSSTATLNVHQAPSVTKQPTSTTVIEGQSATFESAATGFPAPTVQWEVSTNGGGSWSPIAGATSTKYTIASAQFAENGNQYRAVFTNVAGKATSNAATLTVYVPPTVTLDPVSTTVQVGEGATFESAATGFPTPTVQWEVSTNGGGSWSPIAGATSTKYTIASAQLSENSHEFRAVFTNTAGKAASNAAILTVATTKYSAVAWGQNLFRQLGDGTANAMSNVPLPVSNLKFVTSIAAGGLHTLALLANTTVMAWGNNGFGQLGDGSTATREVPVAVKGLIGVRGIAAGYNHSLALMSNGTVMAWGNNESGQLGTGNTTESEVPVAVKGLTGVRAIAAGSNHSLALMSNGTVMAWGDNESGQLGNGSTAKASTVPVPVKGLTGVTSVSGGGAFSIALTNKGTVMAWGADDFGQLGNVGFEEPSSNVPLPVTGLSGVTAIAAGAQHSLALVSGGTLMAWGENTYGELGNAMFKARQDAPVAVSGLSGATTITAGGQDSAALLSTGSVMTWGIDKWGTLGNGTTGSPSNVPVTVAGITKVASISAGGLHMVAYGEPIPVITAVSPNKGPLSGGTSVTVSGVNLTGATAVKFGAAEASSFTVNSSTSITATAPAGSGTVDVRVTTPSGTSPVAAADHFTYVPPPQIAKLAPKTGPVGGGTSVTITGSSFIGVTAVKFGGVAATSFTVNSSESITAVAPAEPAGLVHVSVTTEYGTSAETPADEYKFAPTVTSVSPNAGPVAGGTTVVVIGTGFIPGTTGTKFLFGSARSKSVSCASSTECTVLSPANAAGTVEVVAIVNKVPSLKQPPGDNFTYS
jgi:alpha-tubulin suppressor-like RCC1 family protein/formiminotetrahydrofolate cyclodeaminase